MPFQISRVASSPSVRSVVVDEDPRSSWPRVDLAPLSTRVRATRTSVRTQRRSRHSAEVVSGLPGIVEGCGSRHPDSARGQDGVRSSQRSRQCRATTLTEQLREPPIARPTSANHGSQRRRRISEDEEERRVAAAPGIVVAAGHRRQPFCRLAFYWSAYRLAAARSLRNSSAVRRGP
jgi:hypothetical protein